MARNKIVIRHFIWFNVCFCLTIICERGNPGNCRLLPRSSVRIKKAFPGLLMVMVFSLPQRTCRSAEFLMSSDSSSPGSRHSSCELGRGVCPASLQVSPQITASPLPPIHTHRLHHLYQS